MKGQISLKNLVSMSAVILSWPQASRLGVRVRSRVLRKEARHWKPVDSGLRFRASPSSLAFCKFPTSLSLRFLTWKVGVLSILTCYCKEGRTVYKAPGNQDRLNEFSCCFVPAAG